MLHQASRNSGINLSLSDYKGTGNPYQCSRNRKKSTSTNGGSSQANGTTSTDKENVGGVMNLGSLADKPDSAKPPKKRNRTSAGGQAKLPGQTIILPTTDSMAAGPIAPVYNLATMSPVEGGLINTFELGPPPPMHLPLKESAESLGTEEEDKAGKRRRGRLITKRSDSPGLALPQQLPMAMQFFPPFPNGRPLQYHQYCPEDLSATGGRPTATSGTIETNIQPAVVLMPSVVQVAPPPPPLPSTIDQTKFLHPQQQHDPSAP